MNGTLKRIAARQLKSPGAPQESMMSKLMRIIFLALFVLGAVWVIQSAVARGSISLRSLLALSR